MAVQPAIISNRKFSAKCSWDPVFDDACGATLAANVRPLTFGQWRAQVQEPETSDDEPGMKTTILATWRGGDTA